MPLAPAEVTDLREFVLAWYPIHMVPVVDQNNDDFSDGVLFEGGDGNTRGGAHTAGVYDFIRDRYIHYEFTAKNNSVTGLRNLYPGYSCVDALHRDETDGWWVPQTFDPGGPGGGDTENPWENSGRSRWILGQPNLENSTQTLYVWSDAVGGRWSSVDMSTGIADTSTNRFPNVAQNVLSTVSTPGIASGVAGYHNDTSIQNNYNAILFDGMTDTSTYDQETHPDAGILRGGSSHPKGLILRNAAAANFIGGGVGNNVGRRWLWIDADTGEAVGVLGIEINASGASNNTFAGPSIDGKSFGWDHVQFVPDEGSTFAQPKGELHVTTQNNDTYVSSGVTVTHPGGSFTATVNRQFVAIFEFNPYGVQTGTVRVHNRKIFVGVMDLPVDPIIAGGATAPSGDVGTHRRSTHLFYHPPSRSWVNRQAGSDSPTFNNPDMPLAGQHRLIRFRRLSTIASLTGGAPTSAVTENRVVRARVLAQNDFNLRAAGVTISFTLYRLSTRAEAFDGTALGTGNIVVEAGEIDDDGHFEIRSGNDVDNGGTLLVEGVDYNAPTYATGTISPIGSWPTATLYVRYRHRGVRLTPAHGSLLSSTAVTDVDGAAFALIDYADNLDGELDELEATDE